MSIGHSALSEEDCLLVAEQSRPPGRPFLNRVLFSGLLTCRSPLHIASGEELDQSCEPRRMIVDAAVETDADGHPVIPGSALKGVLRQRVKDAFPGKAGESLADAVFGRLEANGTSVAVGQCTKVDCLDAPRAIEVHEMDVLSPAAPPHWDKRRGTYVAHSVSLTDEGVAKEHHLYSLELVPPGTIFRVELWGRNLAEEEIALVLWLLSSFNDEVWPITLGGHSGRGFGVLAWTQPSVCISGTYWEALRGDPDWASAAASWFETDVRSLREALRSGVGKLDAQGLRRVSALADKYDALSRKMATVTSVSIDVELELLSDLVVRGYPSEGVDEATFTLATGQAKTRGLLRDTKLAAPGERLLGGDSGQVGSLAFAVRLDGATPAVPHATFELPGSSLRGAMRAVCRRSMSRVEESLFGSLDGKGRISFEPFASPDFHGGLGGILYEGQCIGTKLVVKERAPLDRMVGGVKHGGLHRFLAVRRGVTMTGRVRIFDLQDDDLAAIAAWRDRLNVGLARLGGVVAEGDGQVAMSVSGIKVRGKRRTPVPALPEPGIVESPATLNWAPLTPAAVMDTAPPLPESVEPYAMNPYDFVPFPRGDGGAGPYIAPVLCSVAAWEGLSEIEEDLLSGRLTVRLDALQPVFVAGRWTGDPRHGHWQFHRAQGGAAVPGASIRGMLRSYVEAAWNCWVSTYTRNAPEAADVMQLHRDQPYGKRYGGGRDRNGRYVGFNTDTSWRDYSGVDGKGPRKPEIAQALPKPYVPRAAVASTTGVDVATFLFGAVLDPEGEDREGFALRSRVSVGDAMLDAGSLSNTWWYPDLGGRALLGGAKPSKSSMMYFEVEGGTVRKRETAGHLVAQFSAGPFRGRKFYFHQDARLCAKSYRDTGSKVNCWARAQGANTVKRHVEALDIGGSAEFHIWFDRVPACCLSLLLDALSPSSGVRHKLGGLKAFGFGSVSLTPIELELFGTGSNGRLVRRTQDENSFKNRPSKATDWQWACDARAYRMSDLYLRYLLTYPQDPQVAPIFCYPAFGTDRRRSAIERGFAVPNAVDVLGRLPDGGRRAVFSDVAKYFNRKRADRKRKITLHLGLLQRGSQFFPEVCRRSLRAGEQAADLTDVIHSKAKR